MKRTAVFLTKSK